MTVLGVAVGIGVFLYLEPKRGRHQAAALGTATALLPIAFPLALAGLALLGAWGLRDRFRGRKLEAEEAEADVALLADLVGLGLRAGLGLTQALERAAGDVAAPLAAEVRGVVRSAGRSGTAAALAAAEGRAGRLYRIAARAAATGAPLADAVEAYANERRHADHARAAEQARRLPVRMLLPLALLILPGFVVLAVGPALLEALERLQLAP